MNETSLLVNVAAIEGRGMRIALDYDGTVTEDPDAWVLFVRLFKERGHDIRVVTFRKFEDKTNDMVWFSEASGDIPLVFTGRQPKKEYCKSIGWEPDVWIDDNVELILHPTEWSEDDYAAWQETIKEDVVTEV